MVTYLNKVDIMFINWCNTSHLLYAISYNVLRAMSIAKRVFFKKMSIFVKNEKMYTQTKQKI